MPSLSERLKVHAPTCDIETSDLLMVAAAVCTAVEAFQAAEQALKAVLKRYEVEEWPVVKDGEMPPGWAEIAAVSAAKARLLEVNLG